MRLLLALAAVLATAAPVQAQELFYPKSGRIVAGQHPGELAIAGASTDSVRAARDGTVAFVGSAQGAYHSVIVAHGHGYESLYVALGHVHVKKGAHVAQGETLFGPSYHHTSVVRFSVRRLGKTLHLPPRPGDRVLAGASIVQTFPGLSPRGPRQPAVGRGQVVALSYVDPGDEPTFFDAIEKSGIAARSELYFGNYGVAASLSAQSHAVGARYAPLFVVKGDTHPVRKLAAAERARVADHTHAGKMPNYDAILGLKWSEAYSWGREKGRRMRDEVRGVVRAGALVEAWQLDELVSEVVGSQEGAILSFTSGILAGLYEGRAELGDRPMKGVVYFAHNALPIVSRRGPAVDAFFRTVDRTCFRLAGEEYPDFSGDARSVARSQSAGQRALAASHPSLARRYMAGLTPGENLVVGLGGNTGGKSRAGVNAWRLAYLTARRQQGVAGIAEYNWRRGNHTAAVMNDTLGEVARVLH